MMASGSVLAQDVETEKGKLSYAVGWDIGADIKRRSTEFDVESLISAIRDVVAENEPKVSADEMRTLLTELQEKVRAEQVEQFRALSEKNQAESEAFLEANKSKTGIVVLPSGVQYRKMDGREFDSSFARGTPEEFTVNAVLQGWQEVLPLMKAGSTWQIFVPPELAFGARGNPPVGPNEALMFDLKLVEILP
jgi:FKBP-type peptidyl-prolyl cis-trans isomerase FklB